MLDGTARLPAQCTGACTAGPKEHDCGQEIRVKDTENPDSYGTFGPTSAGHVLLSATAAFNGDRSTTYSDFLVRPPLLVPLRLAGTRRLRDCSSRKSTHGSPAPEPRPELVGGLHPRAEPTPPSVFAAESAGQQPVGPLPIPTRDSNLHWQPKSGEGEVQPPFGV